jgi:hypothetical protein
MRKAIGRRLPQRRLLLLRYTNVSPFNLTACIGFNRPCKPFLDMYSNHLRHRMTGAYARYDVCWKDNH